jgi:hypothetical protein
MAQHYSIKDFFRQMPNALLARLNPRRCVKGVR